MPLQDLDLGQILLSQDYLTGDQVKKAKSQAEKAGLPFREFLISNGVLPQALLGQALAEYFGVLYVDLQSQPPQKEDVLKIPESLARTHDLVLVEQGKKEWVLATSDPANPALKGALKSVFPGVKFRLTFAFPEAISRQFYHYRKPLQDRLNVIVNLGERLGPRLFEEIVEDALVFRSSDVHLEPQEELVLIRFRVDGVLRVAGQISKDDYEAVLNRIKVEASLRIDEHFAAQDGSIRFTTKTSKVDMRVSIVPILTGEKVVIRLLSEYVRDFTMQDLGVSEQTQVILDSLARKPFGMIVVAGPTGAGKSTTLYALIKQVNRPELNITTIEDPVEYRLSGINQIQVNEVKGISFSKGLRSIVRQDPNIILVGEIRDRETAEISVNAALTGHLLFSTFHANDAATAIPRLLDMGVEPFLLASTLEAVMSQRLIRRICVSCRYSEALTKAEFAKQYPTVANLWTSAKVTLFKGKGCESCEHTGYRGRTAIFEIIPVTPEIEELLLSKPSTAQIWKAARKNGARNMFEDGLEKVKDGSTSLEELLRVVPVY